MPIIPTTGFRYYSKIPNSTVQSPVVSFGYVLDSGVVWQQQDNTLVTGAMRPVLSTDLASVTNLSVSGLSLSVGAVAITGNPQVSVSNGILPTSGTIQGGNTLPLNVTGIILTQVTGNIGGTVQVNSVAITGAPVFTLTGITPVTITNSPTVTVGNTAPMPISGVVQANVSTVDTGNRSVFVVNALSITGTQSSINLGGYVGITGTQSAINLGGFVGITGGVVGIDTGIRAVTVTNVGPIAISGIVLTQTTGSFSATVDNSSLILAVASGNTQLVISNQINSGISGLLSSNLAAPAWVTGQVSLTNTAPLAISGVVLTQTTGTLTASIAAGTNLTVTGGQINVLDNSGWAYLAAISGLLSSNISAAAYVTGTVGTTSLGSLDVSHSYLPVSGLNFNTSVTVGSVGITGNPVVTITGVLATTANVTVNATGLQIASVGITGFATGAIVIAQPNFASTTSATTPSGSAPFTGTTTFTGQALAANPNRIMFFLQNAHTGIPLYVKLGTTAASTGNFSMILNPSVNQGWGGDSFSDDHYRGAVQCSGGAWMAWEV